MTGGGSVRDLIFICENEESGYFARFGASSNELGFHSMHPLD